MARTWILVLNTVLLAGGTCAVSVPLGTGLAWLLARIDLPGAAIGLAAILLMLFVPLYLHAAAWQAGFGSEGWYTLAYAGHRSGPGISLLPHVWLEGWRAAIWVHALAAVPWVVLIVGLGLRLVEPRTGRAALLDGTPWQVFWHVTLPGAVPAVGAAALWVAVVAAGEMTVTDLFAVRTYAEEIYTRAAVAEAPDEAALAALPGVAVTAAAVACGIVLCSGLARGGRPLSLRQRLMFPTGRWKLPLAALAGATLLLVAGVPLANLVYKAGVLVTGDNTGRLRTWSAEKCLSMILAAPSATGGNSAGRSSSAAPRPPWPWRWPFRWPGSLGAAARGRGRHWPWRRLAWPCPGPCWVWRSLACSTGPNCPGSRSFTTIRPSPPGWR